MKRDCKIENLNERKKGERKRDRMTDDRDRVRKDRQRHREEG